MSDRDTIAALATPIGKGGIGIVRLSGSDVPTIARSMVGALPVTRHATLADFVDAAGNVVDRGVALYFQAPNSYTGEHVLELQGHGGPVVMDLLLQAAMSQGARLARPGEFSERAFLNNRMDLVQAEAVADLIDSSSREAARSAVRAMRGEFSSQVRRITESLIELRTMVEASIDFPDDEIDFEADEGVADRLDVILAGVTELLQKASQGVLLKEGVSVVLAGRPNAGKSSLMNALTGKTTAIVTEIAGTTRDLVGEHVHLDGIPVRLVDTAGLRGSTNVIEKEGVRRAMSEMGVADCIVVVVDMFAHRADLKAHVDGLMQDLPKDVPTVIAATKADLCESPALPGDYHVVSSRTGQGLDELKRSLKTVFGYHLHGEGTFIARARHLQALQRTVDCLHSGQERFRIDMASELLAEELRLAQRSLGEITGEFTSDDLLGRIFSSFCIGK